MSLAPYGTELTHRAAKVIFDWLGAGERMGLPWREGGHAQNHEDWAALLNFADHTLFWANTRIDDLINGPIRIWRCTLTGRHPTQWM